MPWDEVFKVVAALGGVGSAIAAAFTYHRNARTKEAEFLLELHKSFFIDPNYQPMRGLLDCDGAGERTTLKTVVADESPEFTDFLNFFDLVAYLTFKETISLVDLEALLGY